MKPIKPTCPTKAEASRAGIGKTGFALVVTLTLMVLLSILAVGMLSLSSIALRGSSGRDAGILARSNARMALMMAIGQLQREMGPDSRISVPHDVGAQTGGMPRWVATYDAWKTDPANASAALTPQSRVPNFRSWLVSGSNGAGGDMVPMIGPGSVGDDAASVDLVSAPMVDLAEPGRKGKIAWWISDESVKAKVNAGPEAPNNPAFGGGDAFFNAQSAPNVGYKAFSELSGLDWKTGQRGSMVSTGGLNLAAGLGADGVGRAIHDLTVHSSGVLADVREGRLRHDLSSLLARPVSELEDKPLYLADGRMNRFVIGSDGSVSNSSIIGSNGGGANRWGINLEELHLFHQIHREVDWSTGEPQLVNKDSKEAISADRFFIYRRPVTEAVSVMLSFVAEQDTAPDTYKLAGMIDVMVATANPNDIPIVWPSGVQYRVEVEGYPYRPRWNIRRADGTSRHRHTVQAINRPFLQSAIHTGFTLEPGEAAVFGASITDTQSRSISLTRGYRPRGGVRINESEWSTNGIYEPASDGLRAGGLLADDTVDFTMLPASFSNGNTPSGWISCLTEMRNASSSGDVRLGTIRLAGGANSVLTSAPIRIYMINSIRPPQTLEVSEFVGNPLPVLMVTTMSNVEKSRTALVPPNAFASRPYNFREPAIANMIASTSSAQNTDLTMQNSQLVSIAESMEYEFGNDRTLAAGADGGNIYHGGAREVSLAGSFNVIKRRIPLVAPLSLGAFENAIACGLVQRFGSGKSLNGSPNGLPGMAKAIGNSWSNPFLPSDSVFNGTYHDPSWMGNNALWDSWFLSGIVDGRNEGSSAWMTDARSPRGQFEEFVEGTGSLRKKRLVFHPHKPTGEALDELFDGEDFKPSAVNKLSKYLLVDGAFNVNSTSEAAWKAFLTSVRDQELMDADGALQKKSHPFGTLGYAVKEATSGTEGDWSGFRDLSDAEMTSLAKSIVAEVMARGPFLNLADFVNRRPDSPDAGQRALGALQAAIDKSGLNDRYNVAGRTLVPDDISVLGGKDTLNAEATPIRAIGSAGYLSQASLLTAFGSQITVRGDTFVIRTYGDHRSADGEILAKAWCEAVVQRTPDYVDATDAPEAEDTLTVANEQFGRKFRIIRFRWLKAKEI